jgi:hypothetical protein
VVNLSAAQEKVERDFLRKRIVLLASGVILRVGRPVLIDVEATPVGDVVVVFGTFAKFGFRSRRKAIDGKMDGVAAQRIPKNPGADFWG